ncbi:unnamed protein product [Symbiodinium sp. CCMP2592]|nr:unnamed protein product [Symbiodinium sp. CCMP2592]
MQRQAPKLRAAGFLLFGFASFAFVVPASNRISLVGVRHGLRHGLAGKMKEPDRCRMALKAFDGGFDVLTQLLTLSLALSPAVMYEFLPGWMPDGHAAGVALQEDSSELQLLSEDLKDSSLDSILVRLARLLGRSDTFLRLQKPLSSLNYIAAAVLAYNLFLAPSGFPARLPEPLFGLCSVGLGLLILSRVSSATERFSAARSLWADVVSAIRNLSRQAHLWAGRDEFIKFSRWLPALPAAMLCHLRHAEPELGAMLRASRGSRALQAADSSLSDREIEEVIGRPEGMSSPRYVYLRIMALSTELEVPELQKTALENELPGKAALTGGAY